VRNRTLELVEFSLTQLEYRDPNANWFSLMRSSAVRIEQLCSFFSILACKQPLDEKAFPAVALAREAGMAGGGAPAIYNAANEECVSAFMAGRIPFTGIVDTIAQVVSEQGGTGRDIGEIADVLAADRWARDRARELTGLAGT